MLVNLKVIGGLIVCRDGGKSFKRIIPKPCIDSLDMSCLRKCILKAYNKVGYCVYLLANICLFVAISTCILTNGIFECISVLH